MYIYIYVYMYIAIAIGSLHTPDIDIHIAIYVGSIAIVPDVPNTHYIDKYWTSFWSPIGSR